MRISDWSSDVCSSDLAWAAQPLDVGPYKQLLIDVGQVERYGLVIGHAEFSLLVSRKWRCVQGGYAWFPTAVCWRSEEHTSELQSLMRISYDVFCLKKKNTT